MNIQTEKFLQLYKQLEFDGRRLFFPDSKEGDNIIGRLLNTTHLKRFKEELDYCRVVRNFLTHNPKVNGVYPIIPSNEMVSLLEKCVNIINNPPRALEFAITADKILTADVDEPVLSIISMMNRFTYTHIPIFKGDKLIGIFSDNTVYSYLCNEKRIKITDDTKIAVFEKYINLDEHINEYFEFVPKSTMLYEIEELFKYNYKNKRQKLLSVVYITENGKRDEKILGMLTPWDILSE